MYCQNIYCDVLLDQIKPNQKKNGSKSKSWVGVNLVQYFPVLLTLDLGCNCLMFFFFKVGKLFFFQGIQNGRFSQKRENEKENQGEKGKKKEKKN